MRATAKAGTVVGATVLALGLGEALVRALDLGPRFAVVLASGLELSDDPAVGYELRPGAPDGEHRISEQGLRDRPYAVPKPTGQFRIAVAGDSVTFGLGCAREDSYPEQLEAILAAQRPAGPEIEVLNFGVSGYNLAQIVARIRTDVLDAEPDLILYGYVLNDPQAFSFEGDTLARLRARVEQSARGSGGGALERWASHSRLFLLARHALSRGRPREGRIAVAELPEDPGFAAARGGTSASYFRSLHFSSPHRERARAAFEELARISRESGVPIAVAVFPLFAAPGQDYPLQDVHDEVLKWARDAGLVAFDLSPAFHRHAGEALALDFMHPNPAGHRGAARELASFLSESGSLPP